MTFIVDGTNGLTFPNSTTQASAGKVLQVVNTVLTGLVSTSSSSFVDTGLTATITPKFSTSKILAIVNIAGVYKDTNNTGMALQLLRSGSLICYFDDVAAFTNSGAYSAVGASATNYLDSPATTSATTYKVQFKSVAGAGLPVILNVYYSTNSVTSTLTLMEIAQ